jgi:hypothetical protein
LDAFPWFSRQGWDMGNGEAYESAKARHLAELRAALNLPLPEPPTPMPTPGGPLQPLVGYLRAQGTVWHDDTGPRAVRLCSYFPAIRVYRDNPDLFRRNLDSMVGYWHGARIFWCLMGDPWDGVSSPAKNTTDLQVDVRWPDYDDLFVAVLKEFASRGLRVAITSGTLYPEQLPNAAAQYAQIGWLCKSVNDQTVILNSVINEPGMTSPYGDGYTGGKVDPAPWATYHQLLNRFRAEYPWNHHGTGCQGGDPEAIENGGYPSGVILGSKPQATFAAVQGTRFPWQNALERAFDMGYRVRPAVKVPVLEEEPSGNNGTVPAVFQPMDNPDVLFAYYTLKLVTGQALISLNSCGLWEQNPLDSVWGFREMPLLWAQMGLPESVGEWKPANLNTLPLTGTGMYRLDGAFNPTTGETIAVCHDGPGPWAVTSRVTGQVRIYRSDGLKADIHADANTVFFTEGGQPPPTVFHLVPA